MLTVVLVVLAAAGAWAGPARERQLKPCPEGFRAVIVGGKQDCVCEDYHVYWPKTGLCYPEFTRGPCGPGQQLVANETGHAECRSDLPFHSCSSVLCARLHNLLKQSYQFI